VVSMLGQNAARRMITPKSNALPDDQLAGRYL
jgi:hypothetical protein